MAERTGVEPAYPTDDSFQDCCTTIMRPLRKNLRIENISQMFEHFKPK